MNLISQELLDNDDYEYFIIDKHEIVSGWSYEDDAYDALEDEPEPGLRVLSRIGVERAL